MERPAGCPSGGYATWSSGKRSRAYSGQCSGTEPHHAKVRCAAGSGQERAPACSRRNVQVPSARVFRVRIPVLCLLDDIAAASRAPVSALHRRKIRLCAGADGRQQATHSTATVPAWRPRMRRLRITVLDLTTERPTHALYARLMNANLASIMPQVVATWCEQAGHRVRFVCYTGFEDLEREVLAEADLLFVGAFTQAAHTAYAISALHRRRGAVTVLGGPHARCYPQDAARYFDYVLGFTDQTLIGEILRECAPHRPVGLQLSAARQPQTLPAMQERWKFIEPTLAKTPLLKIVPMIGSLGCPYTCPFCIDSTVDYQPLGFDQMRSDLRFLLDKVARPRVGWHDPNFGVRFDDYLGAIEDAVPPGRIDFFAESSLSLLSEPHLERLKRNSFKAILPGIESWFALGNKAKTGRDVGLAKV